MWSVLYYVQNMKDLSIDIETYSSAPIQHTGSYKYIESDDFEILLFSYSIDFGEVKCIDLAQGEVIPEEIIEAIKSDSVTKHAYNASFEIHALDKVYHTGFHNWIDTMFLSLYQAMPASLDNVGKALGLEEDKAKMSITGKNLIKYFSMPCKPTIVNGGRIRNYPYHDKDKWELYKKYNRQDVVTEMEVFKHLKDSLDIPQFEKDLFRLDLNINSNGVMVDMALVNQIIEDNTRHNDELLEEAKRISGLANPNSNVQLLEYLKRYSRLDISDLRAETVATHIRRLRAENPRPRALRLLEIRQALSKTSIKKYYTIRDAVCSDNRVRGLLQYYGASTGRWAGRLVQVQNLKRNDLPNLDTVRTLAKNGDVASIEAIYGDLADVHSQLCRTAFVPKDGKKFVVADFSAIEARVLAWLAGEQWVLEAFRNGKDIYCETASQMFGVKVERHGENGHLRQKGKIAVLALGYGGGSKALVAMGGDKMGLSSEELEDIVTKYRNANKNIRRFWYNCNTAALSAIKTGAPERVGKVIFRLTLLCDGRRALTVDLPSGRKIFYQKPHITTNRFGSESVGFYSYGMKPTDDGWTVAYGPEETYGGKIVENITQAVARDCLAHVMLQISRSPKAQIVMHIHDEVVLEVDTDITVEQICNLMSRPVPWAKDLPLSAAGFESSYYMKD